MNEFEMATTMRYMFDEHRDDMNAAFEEQAENEGAANTPEVESCASYHEAGVMTTDAGFVVRMTDGSEYQVTVKRSR